MVDTWEVSDDGKLTWTLVKLRDGLKCGTTAQPVTSRKTVIASHETLGSASDGDGPDSSWVPWVDTMVAVDASTFQSSS